VKHGAVNAFRAFNDRGGPRAREPLPYPSLPPPPSCVRRPPMDGPLGLSRQGFSRFSVHCELRRVRGIRSFVPDVLFASAAACERNASLSLSLSFSLSLDVPRELARLRRARDARFAIMAQSLLSVTIEYAPPLMRVAAVSRLCNLRNRFIRLEAHRGSNIRNHCSPFIIPANGVNEKNHCP